MSLRHLSTDMAKGKNRKPYLSIENDTNSNNLPVEFKKDYQRVHQPSTSTNNTSSQLHEKMREINVEED